MVEINDRKPDWLKVQSFFSQEYNDVRRLMRGYALSSVCQEAACPNIGECWKKRSAAFLILGDVCTRKCSFCNIKKGAPLPVNPDEPKKLAETVKAMNLKHVVITSVTRDDLDDGGANHFAACINEIHNLALNITVEILTPDFKNKQNALQIVLNAKPQVFNHNIETVQRLYPEVRKAADYLLSLKLLKNAKKISPDVYTKSGIMLGLGETKKEVIQTLDDLRAANVDILTIGQYLRPSIKHKKVERYVTPQEFDEYKKIAKEKGFKAVSSSPLTRSSHNAAELLAAFCEK